MRKIMIAIALLLAAPASGIAQQRSIHMYLLVNGATPVQIASFATMAECQTAMSGSTHKLVVNDTPPISALMVCV